MKSRQHQPLRVPENWRGQDRALVIQLERLLDELYSLTSRLEDIAVTNVGFDSDTNKLTQTINKTVSDVASIATLDGNGKIPAALLPSYVDDVEEYEDTAHFPATGESDKIYVALDTGFVYRWSGTQYVRLNTYDEATQSASGLMSAADKTKLDGVEAGATANIGTITSVKMNGTTVSSSGEADLGTVITSHQDISGKVDKAGDTMTGNLDIQRSGSVTIGYTAKNLLTGLEAQLIIGSGRKNHGVYSNGYVDSNEVFHQNAKWMIYRDANNDIIVNGKATENVLKAGDTMTGDLTGTNFISANYDLETLGSKANGIVRTFHVTSSNSTASFTLEVNHHAFVGIASGFASFHNRNGTLYTTTMPSGFTAAISGSTVTITRGSSTTFIIDGIVI